MTSESRAVSSRTDPVSIALGLARMEERTRAVAKQLLQILDIQRKWDTEQSSRDQERIRFETEISIKVASISKKVDDVSDSLEDMLDRIRLLEQRRDSEDRQRDREEKQAHEKLQAESRRNADEQASLQALETTQRVDESRSRTGLWKALAVAVAAVGAALSGWFASKK